MSTPEELPSHQQLLDAWRQKYCNWYEYNPKLESISNGYAMFVGHMAYSLPDNTYYYYQVIASVPLTDPIFHQENKSIRRLVSSDTKDEWLQFVYRHRITNQ